MNRRDVAQLLAGAFLGALALGIAVVREAEQGQHTIRQDSLWPPGSRPRETLRGYRPEPPAWRDQLQRWLAAKFPDGSGSGR